MTIPNPSGPTLDRLVKITMGGDLAVVTSHAPGPTPAPPPPAPVVDFAGSPLSGNVPLVVSFTDETTGGPSAWAWDFGDGGTSTVQNPTHNYLTAGTYTVDLIATVGGSPYSASKPNYITAAAPPPPAPPTLNLANLVDTSGNGNSLMIGGSHTPAFASDPFGIGQDALTFDGTMQAAGYGPDWIPPTSAFTYQFRIKRDTAHLGVTQGVFGRWATVLGVKNYSFLCYFDSSNNLNFIVGWELDASTNASVYVGPITDGASHAVQFVFSGSRLYAYLDGVLKTTILSNPPATPPAGVTMEFGTYGDADGVAAGGSPFYGVLGDFMVSNIARNTGSNYTVSTFPAVADANTVALIPMASVAGTYIETPAYQGNCLLRGSFAPASGGWANPDGPLPQIGGGWYFTASAYNGSIWTVWGITAPDINTLLSGGGTVGALAIQTPSTGEGDLAGNGSVVPFMGQYWNFYTDGNGSSPNVRYSTGTNLGAPFSPQPGTILFTGYFDPWVRVSPDGTTLTMFMGSQPSGGRLWWKTTSTDGVTWSTPTQVIPDISQAGFVGATGEFSATNFPGTAQWGFSDGAVTGSTTRNVMGWGTNDGSNWLPLFLRFTANGTGNDASGNPYIAVYDPSPTWDTTNNRLVILCSHSTNNQPTQPTNSDIGVWFANVAGT